MHTTTLGFHTFWTNWNFLPHLIPDTGGKGRSPLILRLGRIQEQSSKALHLLHARVYFLKKFPHTCGMERSGAEQRREEKRRAVGEALQWHCCDKGRESKLCKNSLCFTRRIYTVHKAYWRRSSLEKLDRKSQRAACIFPIKTPSVRDLKSTELRSTPTEGQPCRSFLKLFTTPVTHWLQNYRELIWDKCLKMQ